MATTKKPKGLLKKAFILIFAIMIVITISISIAYYLTAISAEISDTSINLKTHVGSLEGLIGLILSKRIEFYINVEVEGHGLMAVPCKGFAFS